MCIYIQDGIIGSYINDVVWEVLLIRKYVQKMLLNEKEMFLKTYIEYDLILVKGYKRQKFIYRYEDNNGS